MKKLNLLAFVFTLLMGVSFTSCLNSDDSTSIDNACTVYVYQNVYAGTPYFVDAIGNTYIPSSASVSGIEQNNSGFKFEDYKMMTIYYNFTVAEGEQKPTINVDPSNPQTYNIDLVSVYPNITVSEVVPAQSVDDIETVAPGTAPVISLTQSTTGSAVLEMFDSKTLLLMTGFYCTNDTEKYKEHSIKMVYVLDEFTSGSTSLTVYIQHNKGTDDGADVIGSYGIYGFNLQQAIQAFTAKTGNAPTRIIVKAKETNYASTNLPNNYTEYSVEYEN